MNERLLERILREAGVPGLVEILAERLSAGDLQSLLMEVYARRARAATPAALLKVYGENRFVRPSIIDPIVFAAFDLTAFALLPPGFEGVELSPHRARDEHRVRVAHPVRLPQGRSSVALRTARASSPLLR